MTNDRGISRLLRGLLASAVVILAVMPASAATLPASVPGCASGVGFLGFSDALDKTTFDATNVGGLSALAFDSRRGVYYSLVDNERTTPARFYTLRIPVSYSGVAAPAVEAVTTLLDRNGKPYRGDTFDGEGMALAQDGTLVISSELEPTIRRFARDGRLIEELPVPARFLVQPAGEGPRNQTFEGLTFAPHGRTLFAVMEGPLASDGATAAGALNNRILRYEMSRQGFRTTAQYFYRTEPGFQGVADVLATSATELLVLERGFVPEQGNTVRIFRVSLRGATDVTQVASLATAGVEPLPKMLLVDIGDCPPGGAAAEQPQSNPLLDNYESIAFGPQLRGNQTLLLQSDDNFNPVQVTRVIALVLERASSGR